MPRPTFSDPGSGVMVKFTAGETEKLTDTGVATAYSAVPACVGCIVQVPVPMVEAVVPETVHTDGAKEAKLTANPELADVPIETEASTTCAGIALNVIGLAHREGTVRAQPFNPNKLELSGDPVPVAELVCTTNGSGFFSASTNGVFPGAIDWRK